MNSYFNQKYIRECKKATATMSLRQDSSERNVKKEDMMRKNNNKKDNSKTTLKKH